MEPNNPAITAHDLLQHSGWLHRLAARLVDPATADDVVQETWVAAMRSPPDRDRPVRPWLAQVMRNLVRNRARSARRWLARSPRVLASDDRPLPSAEELATTHEAQRLVAEIVAGLEEPFRSTVLLCYAEGLAPSEVASRQGIPPGTVRWRLKRGLDEIRTRLDARYGQDRAAWVAALGPLAARAVRVVSTAAGYPSPWLVLAGAVVLAVALLLVHERRLVSTPAPAEPPASVRALAAPPPQRGPGPGAPRPSPVRLAMGAVAGGAPSPRGPTAAAPPGAPAAPDPAAIERAMEVGRSPTRGNPQAPVTMVLYTDFQCPFCARLVPTLESLLRAYPQSVRLAVKNMPLPFHEAAAVAAEAALAAHEQGKFWEMYDRLFKHQGELDPHGLEEHARAIGLDVGKFKAALDSKKFQADVDADARRAKDAGITGTPSMLINGRMVSGAQPLQAIATVIDEELARKGIAVKHAPFEAPPPPVANARVAPPPGIVGYPPRALRWPPPRITLPDELLGRRVALPFTTGDAPTRGPARAAVEVLYLATADCAFCPDARPIIEGLLRSYDVRIVARPLPAVERIANKDRAPVAEALWEAEAEAKFWALHDALVGAHGPITAKRLDQLARQAGMDLGNLHAALEDGAYRARVEQDQRLVAEAGIRLSPAFLVGGRLAEGPVALVQLVEAALHEKGRRPVPPKDAVSLVVDPTAPGYDGQLLHAELSVAQIFAVEPRAERWATSLEKELAPLVRADVTTVDRRASGISFECRATVCRLRASVPGDGVVQRFVRGVYKPHDVVARGTTGEWYFDVRGFTPDQPPEAAITAFRARRSTVLYNVRTGRAALDLGVPADRLPRE